MKDILVLPSAVTYLDLLNVLAIGSEDFRQSQETAQRSELGFQEKIKRMLFYDGPSVIRFRIKNGGVFRWKFETPPTPWSEPVLGCEGLHIEGSVGLFTKDHTLNDGYVFLIFINDRTFRVPVNSVEIVGLKRYDSEILAEDELPFGFYTYPINTDEPWPWQIDRKF